MGMETSLKSGLWCATPSLSITKIPPDPFFKGGETLVSFRISAQATQYGKNHKPYQLQIGFRASGFLGGMKAKPENV
jgi:hypothetical protein